MFPYFKFSAILCTFLFFEPNAKMGDGMGMAACPEQTAPGTH